MATPLNREPITQREVRPAAGEPSLGELFSELTRETTDLVRQEVDLAKTELSAKASRVGRDVGYLAIGGVVAYIGALCLVATVILALIQLGVTPWLSALLVGIVIAAIGAVLVWNGLEALKRTNLVPEQTLETLKGDAEWTKHQMS